MIILVHCIDLFNELNTPNNRLWFTLIYTDNLMHSDCLVNAFYYESTWECQFYFNDFIEKHPQIKVCVH